MKLAALSLVPFESKRAKSAFTVSRQLGAIFSPIYVTLTLYVIIHNASCIMYFSGACVPIENIP